MIARTLQDIFRRYRRPGDIAFSFFFLVFSLFLLSQIGDQTTVAKRAKWFAQPALWPTVAVCGMVFFAALHFVSSAVSPRIPGRWTEVFFWFRSLEYLLYFFLYVLSVPRFGYLPATLVFVLFLAWRTGFRSPRTLALFALFSVMVVLLFRGLLQVKIPAGELYPFLPDFLRLLALNYL